MKKTALRNATAILDNGGTLKGKNLREAAQDLSTQVEATAHVACPATELYPILRRFYRHHSLVTERDVVVGRITGFRRPSEEEIQRQYDARRRDGKQVFARSRRIAHRKIERTHVGQPVLVGIDTLRKELCGSSGLTA